ncbi:MAG: hypothetical protein ACI9XB_002221 [Gammaproteobacteria bacterium]|jgi:hypothetical protein
MDKYLIILIIAITSCSPVEESNAEIINSCALGADKYSNGTTHYNSNGLYELEVPKTWQYELSFKEPYRTCLFQNSSGSNYNFESLTITDGLNYDGYSQRKAFDETINLLKNDSNIRRIKNGSYTVNSQKLSWVLYENLEHEKDDLGCLTLAVLTEASNKKHYFWMLASIFGDEEIENRMCNLIEIINTFKA